MQVAGAGSEGFGPPIYNTSNPNTACSAILVRSAQHIRATPAIVIGFVLEMRPRASCTFRIVALDFGKRGRGLCLCRPLPSRPFFPCLST